MTDREIIALYFDRNEEAILETKNKYGKGLFTIAYRILRSAEDTEECENDTYVSAWNSIPPANPEDYFFAYLARIIRNKVLNVVKKGQTEKRKATVVELTDELGQILTAGPTVEEEFDKNELERNINAFLEKLSADKRVMFLRRYWRGDSIKELAEEMGLSESNVKVTLLRTRNKLAEFLRRKGYQI